MPQSPLQLPVALQSRRASTEWSSLVSMVPIFTGRSREVSRASKALIKRSLGSLFSHVGSPRFIVRVTGAQDSRRILRYITVCGYDTTHLQENPQRLE